MLFNHIAPHKVTRLAASGAVIDVPGRVYGVVLFGGSTATSLKLTNDADGLGTPVLNFNVSTASTVTFDLSRLGPVMFSSKIYGTLAGTGAEAYIFWE